MSKNGIDKGSLMERIEGLLNKKGHTLVPFAVLAVCAVIVMGLFLSGAIGDIKDVKEAVDSNKKDVYYIEEVTESNESTDDISDGYRDAFNQFKYEVEKLQAGDIDIIHRYFGYSDAYTDYNVASVTKSTEITLLRAGDKGEFGGDLITVKIDTVDQSKIQPEREKIRDYLVSMNVAINEDDLKQAVEERVQYLYEEEGNKLTFVLTLEVLDGNVLITEELKSAITGNWYKGVDIIEKNKRLDSSDISDRNTENKEEANGEEEESNESSLDEQEDEDSGVNDGKMNTEKE